MQELDNFGRTVAERTVVLSSLMAEAVQREVDAGKHQTYDLALEHLITRGIAETKRQRDNKAKVAEVKVKAKAMDSLADLLKLNPAIVADQIQMQAALAKLGLATK